jgi:hypothetical protein
MTDAFELYLDSLGKLTDEDLYMDIDETMELRESENTDVKMTKCYGQKRKD